MQKAKDIMKTDLITASANTDIHDAMKTLIANNITGLPVVDDGGQLIGMISEKDMLKLLYEFEDAETSVSNYMTTEVVSFEAEDSLEDIAGAFKSNSFRRVPILSGGKLVGIISRRDIIRHIREMKKQQV